MLASFRSQMMSIRMGAKLSTKLASALACRLTTGVYKSIYSQVDPIRLGENQRKIVIASQYGERLASSNVKEGTVSRLIARYPSHGFVIDREEAEALFVKVRTPTRSEADVLQALPPHLFELQFEKTYIFRLEQPDDQDSDDRGVDPPGDGPAEAPVVQPGPHPDEPVAARGAATAGQPKRKPRSTNDSRSTS
jgi:hypothetical protein